MSSGHKFVKGKIGGPCVRCASSAATCVRTACINQTTYQAKNGQDLEVSRRPPDILSSRGDWVSKQYIKAALEEIERRKPDIEKCKKYLALLVSFLKNK